MVMLSKRLEKLASFVPKGARLLDVGSDHAYLPLYLMEEQQIDFAVAGEVASGPYQTALANVRTSDRKEDLQVRLADGLSALLPEDRIDTVSIAGMGGGLITAILERGQHLLTDIDLLILQPNNREDELRQWLSQNGFAIVAEDIVEDTGKFYEIIVVEKGSQSLSLREIRFGPLLLRQASETFLKRWSLEWSKLSRVLEKIPVEKVAERLAIAQKIQTIKEELNVSE